MPRDLNALGLMAGAIAAGLAAAMDRGPFWEPRDHSARLDAVFGERDRQAAEAKRASKSARRVASAPKQDRSRGNSDV